MEAHGRQISGLLAMHRLFKDRLAEVEARCALLEQATLELAGLERKSAAGVDLPSPAADTSKIPA